MHGFIDDGDDILLTSCSYVQAITNLADALNGGSDEPHHQNTALSPFFEHLVTALLRTGERPDATESNLRPSAYDALSTLVSSAPVVCSISSGECHAASSLAHADTATTITGLHACRAKDGIDRVGSS